MKPKKVSTAPASAKADGFDEIALDDEDADRAEHEAGEDRAAAHHFEPVIEHALLRQRGDRRGLDRADLVGGQPPTV